MKQVTSSEFGVGVNIGRTFTDFVFIGSGRPTFTKKMLSTPDDYSQAVVDGLKEIFSEKGII